MDFTIDCDLLVIGGGLIGAAIARDAAGRGLSVTLCEQGDLAERASALSFCPMRDTAPAEDPVHLPTLRMAIGERETLLRCAPQLGKCLRVVVPQTAAEGIGWKKRSAIGLQNLLSKGGLLPASREIDLLHHAAGGPLRPEYSHGWMYSDVAVDVVRLTVLNAVDAAEGGARILTRTACRSIQRVPGGWEAVLRGEHGKMTGVRARSVINATGGSVNAVLQDALGETVEAKARRSTRILSTRHVGHDYAYLLRAADGRQVHVIPQGAGMALLSVVSDDDHAADDDIATLCATFNRYFTAQMTAADVVWSRSDVWLSASNAPSKRQPARDYRLTTTPEEAPLLSVVGGSLSSHRRLAEEAVGKIAACLHSQGGTWTDQCCLPGGDLYGPVPSNRAVSEFHLYVQGAKRRYSWAPPLLIARYSRLYGSRLHRLLENCASVEDLGREILPGMHELELRYLMETEWARTAADMLRRTRSGPLSQADAEARLGAWIAEATARQYAAAV